MLPVEIYHLIIEYVQDQHDLITLLTTSRVCHSVAERQLYRTIIVLDRVSVPPKVFSRITSCKRVALFVKSLEYLMAKPEGPTDFTRATSLFIEALCHMDNLKALTIFKLYTPQFGPRLGNQFSFQLHSFSFSGSAGDRVPVHFLQSQSQIRDLNCFLPIDGPLPDEILPNLRSISTYEEFSLRHLINHCPITHLRIRSGVTKPLARFLSRSSPPIIALSQSRGIEAYIPQCFPHLRFLECNLGPRQLDVSRCMQHLSQLKNLVRLRILGLETEDAVTLIADLFACNDSLRYIDEMTSPEWAEKGYIWEREKGRQEVPVLLLWPAPEA